MAFGNAAVCAGVHTATDGRIPVRCHSLIRPASASATALPSAAGCRGRRKMASAAPRAQSLRCPGWGSRHGGCGVGARLLLPSAPATGTSFRDLLRRVAGTAHPCADCWLIRGSRTTCTQFQMNSSPCLPSASENVISTHDAPARTGARYGFSLTGLIPSRPRPLGDQPRRLDILTSLRFQLD